MEMRNSLGKMNTINFHAMIMRSIKSVIGGPADTPPHRRTTPREQFKEIDFGGVFQYVLNFISFRRGGSNEKCPRVRLPKYSGYREKEFECSTRKVQNIIAESKINYLQALEEVPTKCNKRSLLGVQFLLTKDFLPHSQPNYVIADTMAHLHLTLTSLKVSFTLRHLQKLRPHHQQHDPHQ